MRCGPDQAGPPTIGRAGQPRLDASNDREVPALFCIVFHCYRSQACERPVRVFPAFCGAFTRSYASRALLIHCY
jgi:hypothetical protein